MNETEILIAIRIFCKFKFEKRKNIIKLWQLDLFSLQSNLIKSKNNVGAQLSLMWKHNSLYGKICDIFPTDKCLQSCSLILSLT